MTSDGTEERDFQTRLRSAILGIGALSGFVSPAFVLVRQTDEGLVKEPFNRLLIVIHDFSTEDKPHAFGAYGGQIRFRCWISIVVENSEGVTGPLPGNLTGLSAGPSLSLIDGALRNAFHANILAGWCMDSDLGDGTPIETEKLREGCIGRRYPFTALKEVIR